MDNLVHPDGREDLSTDRARNHLNSAPEVDTRSRSGRTTPLGEEVIKKVNASLGGECARRTSRKTTSLGVNASPSDELINYSDSELTVLPNDGSTKHFEITSPILYDYQPAEMAVDCTTDAMFGYPPDEVTIPDEHAEKILE